jgi:hypothetical protein
MYHIHSESNNFQAPFELMSTLTGLSGYLQTFFMPIVLLALACESAEVCIDLRLTSSFQITDLYISKPAKAHHLSMRALTCTSLVT